MRQRIFSRKSIPRSIHQKSALPHGGIHIEHRLVVAQVLRAQVGANVEQAVEAAAEPLGALGDQVLDGLLVGKIKLDDEGATTGSGNFLADLFGSRDVDVGDDDFGAAGGEELRGAGADACCCAGYDHAESFDAGHDELYLRRI